MMNESYGFGNFRNKIWLKHSKDLPKEYEIGYHTIFLPLVNFAKKEGKVNKLVKKILEHIAKHRTIDLKQEMRGKIYNVVKYGKGEYGIELGLAGFNKKNVKVQYKDGVLTVSGQVEDKEKDYIEKGLAARKFLKQFSLHDQACCSK
jgi:HSP20 family molecular chaperone IbpA